MVGRGSSHRLVELGGDHGMLEQDLEGDDLQGVLVGGLKDDLAGGPGLLDLEPAGGTDTPAVAGLEAGKAPVRMRGAEVVAKGLRGCEEGCVDDAADGVLAAVFRAGVAAAVTVEAGEGLGAAGFERKAEDVFLLFAGHTVIVVASTE